MENIHSDTSRSNRSKQMSDNAQSQIPSTYTNKSSVPSFQTKDITSDGPSSGLSENRHLIPARRSNKNIRLIPISAKEAIHLFQSNPEYKDMSPLMLNINKNSIGKRVEQQQYGNNFKLSESPHTSIRPSPMSVQRSLEREYSRNKLGPSKPPLGEAQTHQVYAMTDVQAYPMIGESGFRVDRSPSRNRSRVRRRNVSPRRQRSRPRKVVRIRRLKHPVMAGRNPRRNRSRVRRRNVSPRRQRSRPRKVVSYSAMRIPRRPPLYDSCCNPFPMCENDCYPTGRNYYRPGMIEPEIRQSRQDMTCSCNLCMEKLQFIQPGVCPKKKHTWTNEYAIIPKPQVNLIDPCDELDPSIYPRSNNPCIRDSNGNPLTDCIGRPLRDPIGKRFLRFDANGSVMNTNFRGNFYTGQPPLCVKCPMPGSSCAPDTAHNYWMSCGYPIMPNMSPYFERVVANENNMR